MCFSEQAPLATLGFLFTHLIFYTVYNPRSAFVVEARPFVLLYCIAWIQMEIFDDALWQANVQNRCFDLVNLSGISTVFSTSGVFYTMIWYKRGKGFQCFTDWDAKLWLFSFIGYLGSALYLYHTDSSMFPTSPLETTNIFGQDVRRNLWFTDDVRISAWALPAYVAPLLRGCYDNWKAADRFGRMLEQMIVIGIASWFIAFFCSMAAWGSIWCLMVGFILILMDAHIFIAENSFGNHGGANTKKQGREIFHPFSFFGF